MDYQTQFFANLCKIYAEMQEPNTNTENQHFPDITLHTVEDGSKMNAHRIILAASSPYFNKCFQWSHNDVIDIHNGITGDTMREILKYIYSGTISITQ